MKTVIKRIYGAECAAQQAVSPESNPPKGLSMKKHPEAGLSPEATGTAQRFVVKALTRAVVLAMAALPVSVMGGAGFGDTTNPSFANGKMRSFYANSPSGVYPAGACFDAAGNAVAPVAGGLCDSGGHASGLGLRKFVDTLPGLGAAGANNLGSYISVATADTTTYADADYYEVAVVEYTQRMHSDLPNAVTLRGYVQIDAAATDAAAGLSNGAAAVPGSQRVALRNPDGSAILIARPDASVSGGFRQVQAYGVDRAHYLGPAIVAQQNRPVRLKFYNALPTGRAANGQRLGDLFLPVDETLPGAGFGPDGKVKYTQNRAAVHLHGGDTPWISDGTPHQWIAPAGEAMNPNGVAVEAAVKGVSSEPYLRGPSSMNVPDMAEPGPGAATYFFPNGQSARLAWYHDHTLGLTRLNAYAGMAAPYVLRDAQEAALTAPGGALAGLTEIPLVIQDRTFVPANIAQQDARWDSTLWGRAGDLWFSHVMEVNQDPRSADGTNPVGRWDWGPFFWPVFPSAMDLPTGEHKIYAAGTRQSWTNQVTGSNLPGPSSLGLTEVTTTPEAFHDTPVVNGVAYPKLSVEPRAYRLRILNGANDRMWNLGFYVAADAATVNAADPAGNYPSTQLCDGTEAAGTNCSEVRMVPFSGPNTPTNTTFACPADGLTPSTPVTPISFPCSGGLLGTGWGVQDNRPAGVPDPRTAGPSMWLIGTEGGFVPAPVEIPPTPFNYEYNKRSVTVLGVLEHGLFLGNAERADVVVDFSKYAGKTLILYNDAASPIPAGDPRLDYYTGVGDQTGSGGASNTRPGYGPNTRTVMQIKVAPAASGGAAAYDFNALKTQLTAAYVASSQGKPIVPQAAYAPAYPSMTTDNFASIFTGSIYLAQYQSLNFTTADSLTYTPAPTCTSAATCQPLIDASKAAGPVTVAAGTPIKAFVESKAIQELFEPTWGRMNATLGIELPFTSALTQTTIPLGYIDPATEKIGDGETQFWKVTHNGVDTHPVHFHMVNVQVVNRVGWDGTIKPPLPEELGWKETVKMNPLEDIVVAVRAKRPLVPFGQPHSYRAMDPTQPVSTAAAPVTAGFTQINVKTGMPGKVTNELVDFQNEYVWHCHILGHEENDFMRTIVFNAKEIVPASLSASAGSTSGGAVQVTWADPTPAAGQPGVSATPSTTLANPANEIGFRVERANIDPTGKVGAYVALGTPKSYTSVLPAKTAGAAPTVFKPTVNTQANAVSFTDTTASAGIPAQGLAVPAAPTGLTATVVNSDTAALSWTPAGAAEGFLIYRDGVQVAAVAGTVKTYTDAATVPGTHAYEVSAFNGRTGFSYRVAAVTAVGEVFSAPITVPVGMAESPGRASASVTLVPVYPATGLSADVVSATGTAASIATTLELKFQDNSSGDAAGYQVEACVGTCTAGSPVAAPTATVATVSVTNGGTGYTTAPAVTVVAPPTGGTAARAVAVIGTGAQAGKVVSVRITNAGAGYVTAPAVSIASPRRGTRATASSTITTPGIAPRTNLVSGGTGGVAANTWYTVAPSVVALVPAASGVGLDRITLGPLTLSDASANTSSYAFRVSPILTGQKGPLSNLSPAINLRGTVAAPSAASVAPGAAAGQVVLGWTDAANNNAGYTVQQRTVPVVAVASVTNTGNGYLTAPTVTFSAPPAGGTAPVATAVLGTGAMAGQVVSISVTKRGIGYTQAPNVTLSAPPAGGTRATANSLLGAAGTWANARGASPGGNAAGASFTGLASGVAYQFQVRANAVPGGAAASAYVQVPAGNAAVIAP